MLVRLGANILELENMERLLADNVDFCELDLSAYFDKF